MRFRVKNRRIEINWIWNRTIGLPFSFAFPYVYIGHIECGIMFFDLDIKGKTVFGIGFSYDSYDKVFRIYLGPIAIEIT